MKIWKENLHLEKEITVGESPLLTAVSPKPQAHQQNAAKTQKKKIHILFEEQGDKSGVTMAAGNYKGKCQK